jgi:hypothetical protein
MSELYIGSSLSPRQHPATRRLVSPWRVRILGSALALIFLFPYFLGSNRNLRLFAMLAMVSVIFAEVSVRRTGSIAAARTIFLIIPGVVFIVVLSILIGHAQNDPDVAMNMQRILILLPLGIATGFCIFRSKNSRSYVRVLVAWGCVASIGAATEFGLNRSILGREEVSALARDGHVRGIFAAQHPLVLGTVLAACIPLVIYSGMRWPRLLAVVLLVGSYTTGSRGPTFLAAGFLLLQFVPRAIQLAQKKYRLARLASVTALVTLLMFAFFVWSPVILGSTGDEYSTGYRSAIYSFLPEIFGEEPFGYGFSSIPAGHWLIYSQLRGVLDLAHTVDSEIVYIALGFGVLGVGAFAVIFYLGVAAMRYNYAISASCTVVSAAGMVLALHAWDSIGPFWYVLIGGASWAIVDGRSRCGSKRGFHFRALNSANHAPSLVRR